MLRRASAAPGCPGHAARPAGAGGRRRVVVRQCRPALARVRRADPGAGNAGQGSGLADEERRSAQHPLVLFSEAPAMARPFHPGGRRCRASAQCVGRARRAARFDPRISCSPRARCRCAGAGGIARPPARLWFRRELPQLRAGMVHSPRTRSGIRCARPGRAARGGARPCSALRHRRARRGAGPHSGPRPARSIVRRSLRGERRGVPARRGHRHRCRREPGEGGAHRRRRRRGRRVRARCGAHIRAGSPTGSDSDSRWTPSAAIT